MADTEQAVAIDVASSLMEQLGKAFLELKTSRDAFDNNVQWTEIEAHFRSLETSLKQKSEELEIKEKEFAEKESETRALLAEKGASVVAKEQDMLDRIQELKDGAAAAIAEERKKHAPDEEVEPSEDLENKVSSSLGDDVHSNEITEEESPDENSRGVAVKVEPRPELTQFCEQMDAKGLLNFCLENVKILSALRDQLSIAMESASEPARLVLDSLEGFYPPDETHSSALSGTRRACVVVMEAMAALLARAESADPGPEHVLSPETKQQAKAIADEWKTKLANGKSLEAEAFLRLLATFSISSEFDEEEICKIVITLANRKETPQLCRSLGLTHKMPGVIEALISSGKQIDAVHFIQAFELAEKYPPVPLLKMYMKDLRRNSQGKGPSAPDLQVQLNTRELMALKAVMKCVKQYKFEAEYPLEPMQRRIDQLDTSRTDKKRSADSGRQQQPKKQRANGGGYQGPRGGGGYPSSSYNNYQVGGGQSAYYNPHSDRLGAASYNRAPPAYGNYAGAPVPSSHLQYM